MRSTDRSGQLNLALERELHEGEHVLWKDMQSPRVDPQAFVIYFFAVPWTAFSLMWTSFAIMGVANTEEMGWIKWAFPLFGLPFILIGLGMMAVPWMPRFQKGRVLYAVTNRRLLKLKLGRELVTTELPADRIGLIQRREGPDGSGSLKIAAKIGRDSDGDATTEFFEIGTVENIKDVHDIVGSMAA